MITFVNIKSGEKVVFDGTMDPEARAAHMAAYLNSSNLSPNALKGQDFGWRLAPEIVDQMDKIKTNPETLDMLARRIGVSMEDVRDFHILNYVAEKDFAADAIKARESGNNAQFEQEYNDQLKALREGKQAVNDQSDSANETVSAKMPESKTSK